MLSKNLAHFFVVVVVVVHPSLLTFYRSPTPHPSIDHHRPPQPRPTHTDTMGRQTKKKYHPIKVEVEEDYDDKDILKKEVVKLETNVFVKEEEDAHVGGHDNELEEEEAFDENIESDVDMESDEDYEVDKKKPGIRNKNKNNNNKKKNITKTPIKAEVTKATTKATTKAKVTIKGKDRDTTTTTTTKRLCWDDRYKECIEFKSINGHCNIPTDYKANKGLGIWVQEQRRNYKLIKTGQKPRARMTDEMIHQLDTIGFHWGKFIFDPMKCDESAQSWDTNFEKLKQYYEKNGHFNVPLEDVEKKDDGEGSNSNSSSTAFLAKWTIAQRYQQKQRVGKVKSFMTKERASKLESIGFNWNGQHKLTK